MNRIQMACYCLIASAFVLAGLLVLQLGGFASTAEAEMVIARDNFSLMTARTRQNEEALFVLDNRAGRILVYRMTLKGTGGRLDFDASIDVNQIFAETRAAGAGAGGR